MLVPGMQAGLHLEAWWLCTRKMADRGTSQIRSTLLDHQPESPSICTTYDKSQAINIDLGQVRCQQKPFMARWSTHWGSAIACKGHQEVAASGNQVGALFIAPWKETLQIHTQKILSANCFWYICIQSDERWRYVNRKSCACTHVIKDLQAAMEDVYNFEYSYFGLQWKC